MSYFNDITQHTQSAMSFTEQVTTKWSSRLAGSSGCLECGAYLKQQFELFCDKVESQDFNVRPAAFLGYIRINVILYILASTAFVFSQLFIATCLSTLSVIITVFEFFIYNEFVDFLFPLKKGRNVYGTITPSGEIKQRIILSGHHDSAHIFNFLEKDPLSFNTKVRFGLLSMIVLFLSCWLILFVQLFYHFPPYLLSIFGGVFVILNLAVIPLYWFYNSKKGTPGAGDNMICTAVAMEVGKYFSIQKGQPSSLKHTEVIIASWDAEECGLRGSRAYCKAHKGELTKIKTYNFNLECLYDHRELNFLTSDLNNFVPLSEAMVKDGIEVAAGLGYEVTPKKFPLLAGGTDAAEFAKIGIEATCLAAMSWEKRTVDSAYHTTRDTIDAVDEEAVKRSIEIGIGYVVKMDKKSVNNSQN